MTHLADGRIADAVEGALDADGLAHLTACAACTRRVDAARAMLEAVRGVPAADPSPMFWQHFGARVDAAINRPAPARTWLIPWRAGWLAAAAVILLSAIGFHQFAPAPGAGDPPVAPRLATSSDAAADDDEAWEVMRSLAGDLDYDDMVAAGMEPRPGSVDGAATELSSEEQAELVRLIQDELKRTGA